MVNVSQVQRGATRFVDEHIAPAFDGWQKAVVAGGAALLAANLPNIVKIYSAHPLIGALGVMDGNGNIDIDALYNAFVPKMGVDKIPLNIPKIGTIKLGREEIDILVRYIKEA